MKKLIRLRELVGVLLFLSFLQTASAFYDPAPQRWINRDPLGDHAFIKVKKHHAVSQAFHQVFLLVGDNPLTGVYNFANNSAINKYDYLGLTSCAPPDRGQFAEAPAHATDCTKALPLPANSPACSAYGDGTYLGADLQCFCQCAGDSQWSQNVRGCLACEFQKGTPTKEAHKKCYAANGGLSNGPYIKLAWCFFTCTPGNEPTD